MSIDYRAMTQTSGGLLVPQSAPLPGQVANSAGGYAYPVDDWTRLDRFLILGTEGGTYYINQQALTLESAYAVQRCIAADGRRAVERIAEISFGGRAAKNDPALFALAMAAAAEQKETRSLALKALPKVARTGTHLLHFVHYVDGMRGWGRALREAIAEWYQGKPIGQLVYQAIKYQQRDGWSQRDLLRLSHPKASDEERNAVYHWMVHGWPGVGDEPHSNPALAQIWAMEYLKRQPDPVAAIRMVQTYNLPREALPSETLRDRGVWEALLQKMPMTAMIRNLATMTRVGLFGGDAGSGPIFTVTSRLTSPDYLKRARVHPIAILAALLTYKAGKSVRGDNTWTPVPAIGQALEQAFYLSFDFAPVTMKRILYAIDISGSMDGGTVGGVPGLTPRVASAAMGLLLARTEPYSAGMVFNTTAQGITFPDGITLEQVCRDFGELRMGGTDCSLPMRKAMEARAAFDAFVVFTDSETWVGGIHPSKALQQYRKMSGIPAKLIVVGMVSNGFTIADPADGGMMDVVGFDTATPRLIADFISGGQVPAVDEEDDAG